MRFGILARDPVMGFDVGRVCHGLSERGLVFRFSIPNTVLTTRFDFLAYILHLIQITYVFTLCPKLALKLNIFTRQ